MRIPLLSAIGGCVLFWIAWKLLRMNVSEAESEEESPISYKKTLVVGNKMDLDITGENYRALLTKYGEQLPVMAISA
jgi:hypothetical protein